MTIAVGMIGSDGCLIAIDRQLMQPAGRDWELDDYEGIRKITDLRDVKVAYARVGDSFTKDAGEMLATALRSDRGFDQDCIEHLLKNIATRASRPIKDDDERSLLVVFYDSSMPEMWRVRISPAPVTAERITTYSIRGATGNEARYFRHYFPKEYLPVNQLVFLASHLVLSAGQIDPVMIDGLDVAIVTNGICRLLTDAEINELRSRSLKLDSLLNRELMTPSGSSTAG